ncbi:M16 family metallopeptidase [Streptomyces sp. JH34]|uniref:M16 family metallopeptidase n=1 Tax=Streptomyces sp. JH34 TaxID=2793633 RepID=UPI0023F80ACF|nr:M16 family metallopeptidase [Streptomyces sp. JH34]MDF6019133.1 insulinase family protein [Streptomyces sp. JH34]
MSTARPQPRLYRFTLPNGLRVVLDTRSPRPRVAVAVHYGTGFRSEPPGREGFAHLFEHLMFRGSASLPDGRFYDHVHRFGGHANGTTHQDYTDYYQVVPAQALERALFAEADRMRAPLFTPTALAEQLRGVEAEIDQAVHSRPYGGFPWPLMPGVLFDRFANAHDGYGEAERLRTTTVADCAEFFATHYAPGNAVLTVLGTGSPGDTRALVERHFGGIPARPVTPPPARAEPRRHAERWVECTEPGIAATAVATGHRLPDPAEDLPGYLAHAVLARLTSEQGPPAPGLPAVSTSCGFFGPLDARDPDALVVTALLEPGTDPKEATAAVARQWAGWSRNPPAEAVHRTVRRMVGEHHRDHGDLETRCRALGRLESLFGRADLLDRLPDLLAAVGPAEVAAAAGELAGLPATVLVMRPGSVRTRPARSSTGECGAPVPPVAGPGLVPVPGAAPAFPLPGYGSPGAPEPAAMRDSTLDNGLRVITVADRRSPSLEARLRLPLGPLGWLRAAGPEASVRARLARTRAAERAAALGGSLTASVDGQWVDVTGHLPPGQLPAWLALLASVVAPPRRDDGAPAGLRSVRPTPPQLMDDAVRRHWSDGRADTSVTGTPAWDPRGGAFVLLGDIDPERASAAARKALEAWPPAAPLPEAPGRRPEGGRLLVLRSPAAGEVHLTVCAPEPEISEMDAGAAEAARYLATAVFGGYFGSRLATRMRVSALEGYEVYSGRDVVLDLPRVFVRARVAPHLAEAALDGIREELRLAEENPFTDAEVEAAREFCAAQALGAFDSPATQADQLRQLTAAGRDPGGLFHLPQLLRRVPAHDVARAGRELFATPAMDTVLFGPVTADRAAEIASAPLRAGTA